MPRFTLTILAVLLLAGLGLRMRGAGAAGEQRAYLPLVACSGCPGVATPPPASPAPSAMPTPDPAAFAARMVGLVNGARLAAGCPAALSNATLMQAAQAWSEYMLHTGDYSHGTTEQFEQKYAAYPGGVLENLAAGSETPDYAFTNWMLSSSHRRNLTYCLSPDDIAGHGLIYEIGVGFADGYWTLVIGWRMP